MGLTFPLRRAAFRDVADISLLQGRLRGADELIDGRQDLRAREDDHRVKGAAGQDITASRKCGCRTDDGVTVSRHVRLMTASQIWGNEP
jgi:hypothetical protein